MKLNCRFLLYLPIIFFFLPAFAFSVIFFGGVYSYFFIILYIVLCFLIINNPKKFIQKIGEIYRFTPFKIFVIMTFLIIINSFILSFIGISGIFLTIRNIFFKIILCIYPVLVFYLLILEKFISLKRFVRLFVIITYFVIIMGFIAYIGQMFDLSIINNMFDVLANRRLLLANNFWQYDNYVASNYVSFGFPRLDNLYDEPAFYARFLYLFMPFIYASQEPSFYISKNKLTNFIIKKTIVPFTWLSILLTQSAIYLIFCFLLTFIIYYKQCLIFLKKYYVCILLVLSSLVILYINIFNDFLANTYMSRVISVIINIKSVQDIILIEPSLGSRLISFYNTVCVFIKHPFGVGIGNLNTYLFEQTSQSILPLTFEVQSKYARAIVEPSKFMYNRSIIYSFLATHGIIIFGFFATFHCKLYTELKKFISRGQKDLYIHKIVTILSQSWIALTIIYFYEYDFMFSEYLLIYALILITIYKLKKGDLNNEKNNIDR